MSRPVLTILATVALAGIGLTVVAVGSTAATWEYAAPDDSATPATASDAMKRTLSSIGDDAVRDTEPPAVGSGSVEVGASPPYDGPLIAPTGFREVTTGDIRDFVLSRPWAAEDPDGDEIAIAQARIIVDCMADEGFLHDPTYLDPSTGEPASPYELSGLTRSQQDAYVFSLFGPDQVGPYDWRAAGCVGLAVHETGQDDAR